MKFDKTEPEKYYGFIKEKGSFPGKYIEELFLIAKLSTDKKVKKEATDIFKKSCGEDILNAFKNRSRFDVKEGWKARDKNLLLLLKLAKLSKTLKIGRMYQLLGDDERVLIYDGLKLTEIPQEIGRLDGIKELEISDLSNDFTVPETIGDISSLESLEFRGFKIRELPETIAGLKNLKKLSLSLYNVTEIPGWINDCSSIEDLEIGGFMSSSYAKYKNMPLLKGMKNLKRLDISTIDIEEISDDFFDLPNLEELQLVNIKGLKKISGSVGKMKNLKKLVIANCRELTSLPCEISDLKRLESLKITALPLLQKIDGRVPFMPGLKKLEFANCQPEIDMSGIGSSSIKLLYIRDSKLLDQLLMNADRFPELETLIILECKGLEVIPDTIGKLKNLIELRVEQFSIKDLPESIGELENLETLKIRSEIESIPKSLCGLKKLKDVNITSPALRFSMKALPDNLSSVYIGSKSIDLDRDKPLSGKRVTLACDQTTGSLGKIEKLESLYISNCGIPFSDICSQKSLKEIVLNRYSGEITEEILSLKKLKDVEIIFNESENAVSLDFLGKLPGLKKLKIDYWSGHGLTDIVKGSRSLEELFLYGTEKLNDKKYFEGFVDVVKKSKQLKNLSFHRVEITNGMFEKVTEINHLNVLRIVSAPIDLIPDSLTRMKNLKSLSLSFLKITSLPDWIGDMKALENLEIENPFDTHSFDTLPAGLADIPKLKRLSIYGIRPREVPEELNRLDLEELKIQFSRGWPVRQAVIDILKGKNTRVVGR